MSRVANPLTEKRLEDHHISQSILNWGTLHEENPAKQLGICHTNIYDYRYICLYIHRVYIYIYIERHRVYIHRVYMYTDIFFPTSTLSASLHFLEDCRIPNVRPGIGWGEFIETCLGTWGATVHWWLGQKQKLHTLKVAMFNEEIGV